jgi:hypothetical protein
VTELFREPGRDVVVWASRTLWTGLVTGGVEFTGLGEPRRLPESQNVLLTYRMRPA